MLSHICPLKIGSLHFTPGLQSAFTLTDLIFPHTGNEKLGWCHEYLIQPNSDLHPKSGHRHSIYKDMPAGSNSRRSAPRARCWEVSGSLFAGYHFDTNLFLLSFFLSPEHLLFPCLPLEKMTYSTKCITLEDLGWEIFRKKFKRKLPLPQFFFMGVVFSNTHLDFCLTENLSMLLVSPNVIRKESLCIWI